MSNHPEVWAGPVKIEEWDDHAVPPTYRRWDFDGNLVEERPYTAEEEEERQERLAQETAETNTRTIEQKLADVMAALQNDLDVVRAFIAVPNSEPLTVNRQFLNQTIMRPLRDLLVAERLLVRKAIEDFSGTD